MTVAEQYYEFHLLLNKNAAYKNVNVSPANYVFLFNRETKKWLNSFLKRNRGTSEIHDIQDLLISDEKLVKDQTLSQYDTFRLPEKFFEYADSTVNVSKDKCIKQIVAYLTKPFDVKSKFATSDFEPSYDFEETICNISDKKLLIYKKDFKIKEAFLSYYKIPDTIDIEGYVTVNNTPSSNQDSSLPDRLLTQVNERVVLETMRQFENQTGFQLSKERIIN